MALGIQGNPLGADAIDFRTAIVDGMIAYGGIEQFYYLDADTVAGWCPVCGIGVLSVYFAGYAARADLICRQGCDEGYVLRALTRLAGAR